MNQAPPSSSRRTAGETAFRCFSSCFVCVCVCVRVCVLSFSFSFSFRRALSLSEWLRRPCDLLHAGDINTAAASRFAKAATGRRTTPCKKIKNDRTNAPFRFFFRSSFQCEKNGIRNSIDRYQRNGLLIDAFTIRSIGGRR